MLLYEVANKRTIVGILQPLLPTGIIVKPDTFGDFVITATAGPFDGLDFFQAFGFTPSKLSKMSQKYSSHITSQENNKSDEDEDEDDEYDGYGYGGYEDENDYDWQDACYEAFDKINKVIFNIIPDGWKIGSNICSFERDGYCPYVNITVSRDYNRKSRSRQTDWYHITLSSNLKYIKQHGLQPKSNIRSQMEGYKNRIFLLSKQSMNDKAKIIDLAQNLQSKAPVAFGDSFQPPEKFKNVAVLKVVLSDEFTKRLDPHSGSVGGIYINQPIPPNNIEVIYNGPIPKL